MAPMFRVFRARHGTVDEWMRGPSGRALSFRSEAAAKAAILHRMHTDHAIAAPQPKPVAQPVHCQTCNDNGMIGGPSFYAPDEGGVPCPDCSQPDGMQPLEVLTSVWSAMQNSADGDDLLNKLEHMRDSIERSVQGDQQQALQELEDDAQKVYDGYTAQPVQAKPSDVDFEAKTCPEAFLQQEISKLKTSLATTVDALEMGLQIGDQCSRGFLAKFHKMASDAITNSQPKPTNQRSEHGSYRY